MKTIKYPICLVAFLIQIQCVAQYTREVDIERTQYEDENCVIKFKKDFVMQDVISNGVPVKAPSYRHSLVFNKKNNDNNTEINNNVIWDNKILLVEPSILKVLDVTVKSNTALVLYIDQDEIVKLDEVTVGNKQLNDTRTLKILSMPIGDYWSVYEGKLLFAKNAAFITLNRDNAIQLFQVLFKDHTVKLLWQDPSKEFRERKDNIVFEGEWKFLNEGASTTDPKDKGR